MNNLEKEVKKCSALELACEYNRLLSLAEEDDPSLYGLSDAKRLLYVEEELRVRRDKLLPGLPTVDPPQTEEPGGANYMNVILGSYYKRKSKPKVIMKQLRFFIKVIDSSLNTTLASIPVMAVNKEEAALVAREKYAQRFRNKSLKFEVS